MSSDEKLMIITWACPKCGATPDEHGKGGRDSCEYLDNVLSSGQKNCGGFICECDEDGSDDEHGTSFEHPCTNAVCYHCGWNGKFPKKPKGLHAWEKKALDAGWIPPEQRRKELGFK